MGKQSVIFDMFTDEQIFTVEFVKHLSFIKTIMNSQTWITVT